MYDAKPHLFTALISLNILDFCGNKGGTKTEMYEGSRLVEGRGMYDGALPAVNYVALIFGREAQQAKLFNFISGSEPGSVFCYIILFFMGIKAFSLGC